MNGSQESDPDDIQWQRKTLWVGLAFATMSMPALVCLAGLRRSGRQNYRHSLTEAQKSECLLLTLPLVSPMTKQLALASPFFH